MYVFSLSVIPQIQLLGLVPKNTIQIYQVLLSCHPRCFKYAKIQIQEINIMCLKDVQNNNATI